MKKMIFFVLAIGQFLMLNGFLPSSSILRRTPEFYQLAAAISKTVTDHVISIMQKGNTIGYINEKGLSQVGHAEQAAHCMHNYLKEKEQCALSELEKTEFILAALFHDIGHLCAPEGAAQMDGDGVCNHETIGADYLLNLGFSKTITELIASHAEAKRYLVSREDGYFEGLSPASKRTLIFQGGPMSPEECTAFEKSPYFEFKILLRRCDEAAKDPNAIVPKLTTYKQTIEQYLLNRILLKQSLPLIPTFEK